MQRRDQWVGGAVLIAIGIALLLGQYFGDAEQYVLLGLGIVLLVLFAVSRNPGTLIGGGIVTGLGIGVVIAASTTGDVAGAAVLFGLGGGFIGVWLVGMVMRFAETRIWPLIPGTILVIVGIVVLAGSETAKAMEWIWPLILIGLGVVAIGGAVLGRGRGGPDAGAGPGPG